MTETTAPSGPQPGLASTALNRGRLAYQASRGDIAARDQLREWRAGQRDEAHAAEYADGYAEIARAYAGDAVGPAFMDAARGRLEPDCAAALLAGLDRTKFLNAAGEVDTERVRRVIDAFAPPPRWPDLGQGRRNSTVGATELERGAQQYRDRQRTGGPFI